MGRGQSLGRLRRKAPAMYKAVQSGVRSEGNGTGAEGAGQRYLALHKHVRRWRTGPDAIRGSVLPVRSTLYHDERPNCYINENRRGSRGGRERDQQQDEFTSGKGLPRVKDDA